MSKPGKAQAGPGRKWLRRFSAVLLGLLVILFLEALIRVTGWGLAEDRDLAGWDAAGLPLYKCVRTSGPVSECSLMDYFKRNVSEESFIMPKPGSVFRIFVVGGLAPAGFPFLKMGAFPHMLKISLNDAVPTRQFEVINASMLGADSYVVQSLLPELLGYDPDLIIIYMGNNEFLGKDSEAEGGRASDFIYLVKGLANHVMLYKALIRQISLAGADVKTADNPIAGYESFKSRLDLYRAKALSKNWTKEARGKVLARYRARLTAMISEARSRGVEVLVCTLPADLRDYPPFSKDQPYYLMDRCGMNDDLDLPGPVVKKMHELRACNDSAPGLDPALSMYRRGCCELAAGNGKAARESMLQAMVLDPFPVRTATGFNDVIRETAASQGAILADLERIIGSAAPDGIPGDELFLDYAHLTLRGNALVAIAVTEALLTNGQFKVAPGWKDKAANNLMACVVNMPDDFLYHSYYTEATFMAMNGKMARAKRLCKKKPSNTEKQNRARPS